LLPGALSAVLISIPDVAKNRLRSASFWAVASARYRR
jgi:hypothetical protein